MVFVYVVEYILIPFLQSHYRRSQNLNKYITTSAVTAEKKVASNLSVFYRGTLRRCAGTEPRGSKLNRVQFLRTFVVFLCKKTDKLLATFFSAVTALVVCPTETLAARRLEEYYVSFPDFCDYRLGVAHFSML